MPQTHASFRLFFYPRSTMAWILHHDPNYGVMMISMFAGITAALRTSVIHGLHPLPDLMGHTPLLDSIVAYGIGPSAGLPMTFTTMAIYGSLLGVFLVGLGTLLLMTMGWVFGGVARFREVRSALVWSFVPYSWLLPVWAIYALLHADSLRMNSFAYGTLFPWDLAGGLAWMLAIDYVVRIFCLIWLALKVSVVMHLPVWKAALVVLFAFAPAALLLVPWQGFGF